MQLMFEFSTEELNTIREAIEAKTQVIADAYSRGEWENIYGTPDEKTLLELEIILAKFYQDEKMLLALKEKGLKALEEDVEI